MTDAEWRPVVGWEGVYEVSNDGRVRRVSKPLRAVDWGSGYLGVTLSAPGRREYRQVHALVAEAFLGPRPAGLHIDHRDTDKHHNAAENLEYVTRGENIRRSYAAGTHPSQRGVPRNAKRRRSA